MYTEYTEAGFKVFGLYRVDQNGLCECGNPDCKAQYKHPRIRNWQKIPHWSQEQLDTMEESGQFDTGFGVLCDGYLIIDVDPRNGGFESYKKLCDDIGTDLKKECGFYVETGGGGWHVYYKLDDKKALKYKLPDYPGIEFKTSGFVVGYGSKHASGHCYEIGKGQLTDISSPPSALLNLLERNESAYRVTDNGQSAEVSTDQLKALLAHISPSADYDEWVKVGMALHEATDGDQGGLHIWHEWSQGRDEQKPAANFSTCDKHWHSFGKSLEKVTFGTLKFMAQEGGYVDPVTFDADSYDGSSDGSKKAGSCDVDKQKPSHAHIDLSRPPGFVGEVAAWINTQCLFPLERASAAAAISTIACLANQNYMDETYRIKPNLFVFCVAGSATGKENILQSVGNILKACGLGGTVKSTIKSEQEVIRALIHNPVANFLIDEIGIFFRKITNAQKSGSASYLEGVIGTLMSCYSKSNSDLFLGHDVLLDAIKHAQTRVAALAKLKQENEKVNEAEYQSILTTLANLENGYIEKPFISLLGFTTPGNFHEFVNAENATNGFIGRSLIIEEKNTHPKIKKDYLPIKLPIPMQMKLSSIAEPGSRKIQTTNAAKALLQQVSDTFYEIGTQQLENNLEAIPRRAYELVLKLSMVLAAPSGIRDVEHVEYAFAFVKHDIEQKINLAATSSAADDKIKDEELLRKILGVLDEKTPTTHGKLVNKLRGRFAKQDVQKAIDHLSTKELIKKEPRQGLRGKQTIEYYLVSSGCYLN